MVGKKSKQKWWPIFAVLAVAYVGIYIAFWLSRNTCPTREAICLGDAFLNALGDAWMFNWVWDNGELAAGLLAFAAAATVLSSTWLQRQWVLEDARLARREQSIAAVAQARLAFLRIYNTVWGYYFAVGAPVDWYNRMEIDVGNAVGQLEVTLAAHSAVLGDLAPKLEFARSDIVERLRDATPYVQNAQAYRRVLAICFTVGAYLRDANTITAHDGAPHGNPIALPETLESSLTSFGSSIEEVSMSMTEPLSEYFVI